VDMQIIPTICERDPLVAEARWGQIKETTRWVQVDVFDGVFSYGKSFDLELVEKIISDQDRLVDVHLMVSKPVGWVEKCIGVGASRIIGQVEMMANQNEFIKKVKEERLEVGLAFDVETEVGEIPKGVDVILLMARKAGFEPKELDERVWKKIERAKKWGVKIGVDGGVRKEHLARLEEAGVSIAYVGEEYLNIVNE